jgi:hypothetical protein
MPINLGAAAALLISVALLASLNYLWNRGKRGSGIAGPTSPPRQTTTTTTTASKPTRNTGIAIRRKNSPTLLHV